MYPVLISGSPPSPLALLRRRELLGLGVVLGRLVDLGVAEQRLRRGQHAVALRAAHVLAQEIIAHREFLAAGAVELDHDLAMLRITPITMKISWTPRRQQPTMPRIRPAFPWPDGVTPRAAQSFS